MESLPAVLICGHGSRDSDAIHEFDVLMAKLRERLPGRRVEGGFLEFARPTIGEGFAALAAGGARAIIALPAMLIGAGHVRTDLPREASRFRADHPEVAVTFARDLSVEPKLLRAARARIEAAEALAVRPISRTQTLLLVVGRGSSDADANSHIAEIAALLKGEMGFGRAEPAFAGLAAPLADAALDQAAQLGFARIIVLPYFLFTGVLVKRIQDWTEAAARNHPGIEFLKAGTLADHPLVIETFLARLAEAEPRAPS